MISVEFNGNDVRPAVTFVATAELDTSKRYELIIKEKKNKRSKNANAYFWEFLDQLAVKLRIGKTEIYRALIQDIGGVSTDIWLKNEAVDQFIKNWQTNGKGWFCEVESLADGWTRVTAYYGSSTYDTEQMSRLIDRLIWECNQVGIDTTNLRTKALLEVQHG